MSLSSNILCLVALAVSLAGCSGTKVSANQPKGRKGAGGPAPVTVVKVIQKDVPLDLEAVGNVEAYSTISVKAQVGGELTRVSFREGDFVKAGELLFTIDRRPLEAQLRQAEATLAKNLAQVKQAQANLQRDLAQQAYAKSQAARYARLTQEGIISKDQNDQVQSSFDAVTHAIEADRATIDSARAEAGATQASIDNLKVQLGYTEIRSPITGRTGNLTVKQGNLVTANTMEMMTINQVEPIFVTFAVPESRLAEVKRYKEAGTLAVFASPQDASDAPERGNLAFVDNTVDPSTGTIKLKAMVPNKSHRLWPGQFVRVTLRLTTYQGAPVVPNQAVQTGQQGTYVYVVKPDNTVESRPVTVGARLEQDLVIQSGLTPGETVVVEGQLRLTPGARVTVRQGGGRRS